MEAHLRKSHTHLPYGGWTRENQIVTTRLVDGYVVIVEIAM